MTGFDFLNSDDILDVIMSREWTLNDVLVMDETVEVLVQELIDGMEIETKYNIVKDTYENRDSRLTVGEIISKVLRQKLSDMVSVTVNKYLKDAKVNFITREKDNTVVHKEIVEPEPDNKIQSLKERIRKDSKQLDEAEMKEQGMI
tara:strand:+ start:3754 stop:4191 length:438 start_codon:yes stop_codon:yes gene_type:complete